MDFGKSAPAVPQTALSELRLTGLGKFEPEKPRFLRKKPVCSSFSVCADRRSDSANGATKGFCGGSIRLRRGGSGYDNMVKSAPHIQATLPEGWRKPLEIFVAIF